MRPPETDLRFLIYTQKNILQDKNTLFFNANLLEKYLNMLPVFVKFGLVRFG